MLQLRALLNAVRFQQGDQAGVFSLQLQQWIALNHGLSTRQSLSQTIDFGYQKDTNFPPDILFITQFVSP